MQSIFRIQGNKVDFHMAMGGDKAKDMYNTILSELRSQHHEERIKEGQFGAMMEVNIANDGPVTIEIESLADKSKNTSNDS